MVLRGFIVAEYIMIEVLRSKGPGKSFFTLPNSEMRSCDSTYPAS